MPVSQVDLATFSFEGTPIRLMATQQGIWKPRQLEAALSMRTVFSASPSERPYTPMKKRSDGFLRYKWRGTDAGQADNVSLRAAMAKGLPLIWFQGVARALYIPIYPVYLAAEEPALYQFVVAFEARRHRTSSATSSIKIR